MEEAENTQPKDEPDRTPGVTVEASGQDSEDTSDTEVHYLTGLKVDFLIFNRIFVTICESNLIIWHVKIYKKKIWGKKVNFSGKFKYIDFDLV